MSLLSLNIYTKNQHKKIYLKAEFSVKMPYFNDNKR